MSKKINETAVGGSTGGGSIAVRSDRLGGMQSRMSLKDFMDKFHNGVINRFKFHPVKMEGSVSKMTESYSNPYQVDNAVSRLKGMEIAGTGGATGMRGGDVITYGIEDDQGVMMKVTVPIEQTEDFERYIAQALADILNFKKTGKGEDKTLAELLYEIKDQFTIINAEFPTIPKDAVYNANEISEDLPGSTQQSDIEPENDADLDSDEEIDLDSKSDDDFDPDDEEIGDDFSGKDSKEELLTSLLAMLRSQNEKEIAQANAEAEQAKARQAELALKASQDEMQTQEQLVSTQAEMDAEKEKEKRAKEMAELAKFNYKKKMGEGVGFSPMLRDALLELDPMDTPQTLRRQMPVLAQKYRIDANDDPDEQKFKRDQYQAARRELRVKMQAANSRRDHEQRQQDKETQQQDQQQNQQQNNNTSNRQAANNRPTGSQ